MSIENNKTWKIVLVDSAHHKKITNSKLILQKKELI